MYEGWVVKGHFVSEQQFLTTTPFGHPRGDQCSQNIKPSFAIKMGMKSNYVVERFDVSHNTVYNVYLLPQT